MKYNPETHRRRSIRLPKYDYTGAGAYFVTIVTHGRECVFGEMVDGVMYTNAPGQMVQRSWIDLANRFPGIALDTCVVMPNHFHGIVFIPDVGATLVVAQERAGTLSDRAGTQDRAGTSPAPTLSDRRNIVVIADEAHRSQYDFIDGFARHMRDALPNASFIGFTGTPVELTDKNTRAVFGDYISVYDIQRAVADKATVPIYYESRLARLGLDQSARPNIDPEFEEVTEGEEVARKEKLKSKWAQLEALVGAEKRSQLIARDIVEHFEQRREAMDGKAMIVCMSRRIWVDLYREIVALRPRWHHDEDDQGAMKAVMTGSASDPLAWQPHIRNKPRHEALAKRFRDSMDPFTVAIVRDMWLTGFDAPSLHTMDVDKPMRGHGLMQAIARVNRVFRDKPGGLVVDYLGLSDDELAFYDALETNDSAVKVLGDDTLRMIARELVATLRKSVTIDWTMRENVRTQLRVLVKRILRKYGYPPDKQEQATRTVLEQAEVLSEVWATA